MLPYVALTLFAPLPEARLVRSLNEPVKLLAWTPRGRLLFVTENEVSEWPSGRRQPLHRDPDDPDTFVIGNWGRMAFDATGRRGRGHGFVVDLETLSSKPFSRSPWKGDPDLDIAGAGRIVMSRAGRRQAVAPGWYVLGVSDDGRLALATKKQPFDGDTTYLLKIDPRTGRGTVAAAYPNSSDDHTELSIVQGNGPKGRVFVHTDHLPSGITQPYFAGPTLRPIRIPTPKKVATLSSLLRWIDPQTPWAIAERRLSVESGKGAFDKN
ncbi:hypothetical protein EON79_13915, partial [bacterium]